MKAGMEKVEKITAENRLLKEKIMILKSRLEDVEQYSKRNCIEIKGVLIEKEEDIFEIIKSWQRCRI